MPKNNIQYFGGNLIATRLCLKCGYAGQLIRGVKRCPECHAPFPKRSKEYDEAASASLAVQTQKTKEKQEE